MTAPPVLQFCPEQTLILSKLCPSCCSCCELMSRNPVLSRRHCSTSICPNIRLLHSFSEPYREGLSIDVPVSAKHSTDTYSMYFDQLSHDTLMKVKRYISLRRKLPSKYFKSNQKWLVIVYNNHATTVG